MLFILCWLLFFAFAENGYFKGTHAYVVNTGNQMNSVEDPWNAEIEKQSYLFEQVMPDFVANKDPGTEEVLLTAVNTELNKLIKNLASDDAEDFMYKMKMNVCRSALESAFEKTVGYLDPVFIDRTMNLIESEVKKERESNGSDEHEQVSYPQVREIMQDFRSYFK